MVDRRRSAPATALAFSALLVACGGHVGATAPGEGDSSGASAADSGAPCPLSSLTSAVSENVSTTGAVVAVLDLEGTAQTQSFAAGFPYFGAGPSYAVAHGAAASCTCSSGNALPVPSNSAGSVTVDAPDCGPPLVVMTLPMGPGDPYAGTPAGAWTPGDVLGVVASGASGGIGAFSGTLVTPLPPVDVTPPIFGPTSQPIPVSRSEPLVLRWTPEGRAGETVMVRIAQSQGQGGFVNCTCIGPDAPGVMTIPVSTLSQYVPSASATGNTTGFFTRSIARVAVQGGVSVDLVGLVESEGAVDFQ